MMKTIKNFIKGMIIGISILVPGVSGGTMAIILGIYEDLIHALSSFFENWKKHSILLLEIVLGGLLSIKLFSYYMEKLLIKQPYLMHFLFMGIIIGGTPSLYRKYIDSGKKRSSDYLFLLLGLILVLSLSFISVTSTPTIISLTFRDLLFIYLIGIIIALALVLPGISGSLLLMTVGMYSTTINAINTLNIIFLIPLVLGIVTGILTGSRVIERLIRSYPGRTYMLIIGFVIGSIMPIFPGMPKGSQLFTSLIAFIAGFLIIINWSSKSLIE